MFSATPNTKRHETLLGKEATKRQRHFYEKFPEFRGISDSSLDPEILEAVLISALTFGAAQDRIYFFAPLAHEEWVLKQFNQIADVIFERCKKWSKPVDKAKGIAMLFKKIVIIGKLPQIPSEPKCWVSFGFTTQDFIPEWMEPKLMES